MEQNRRRNEFEAEYKEIHFGQCKFVALLKHLVVIPVQNWCSGGVSWKKYGFLSYQYMTLSDIVCRESIRPASGPVTLQKDLQNAEKLLHSWLWFITVEGRDGNQQRQKL